jgi:sRNA-binding carbon storage regulator CsrA
VTVVVIEYDGGRVRLGVDAPRNVTIRRGELALADARDHAARGGGEGKT